MTQISAKFCMGSGPNTTKAGPGIAKIMNTAALLGINGRSTAPVQDDLRRTILARSAQPMGSKAQGNSSPQSVI
jgi:hypothetical protein